MKVFELKKQVIQLVSDPMIMESIKNIEFYRGRVYSIPKKIKLKRLHDFSIRRSVTSSNEIEGITISKSQEENIFVNNAEADTDEEKMLLGYNDALEYIFEVYSYHELDEQLVLYLHELEWNRLSPAYGGVYKDHQNYIKEIKKDGSSRTVFIPTKPSETKQAIGNLIWQFNDALSDYKINRLILIFVFILDFLCIHPFDDGNGRVSRLLTTFLLMKSKYDLDQYYSISYLILNRLNEYYDALEKSSSGWHEDNNDYSFFVSYMLSILMEGYKKLEFIFSLYENQMTLTERIIKIMDNTHKPLSKADFEELLFANSKNSIEEVLGKLVKSNKIKLLQKGKYALYWK